MILAYSVRCICRVACEFGWRCSVTHRRFRGISLEILMAFVLVGWGTWVGCSVSTEPVPGISLPNGKADGIEPIRPEDCPGGAPRLVDGRPAAWTVLVYQAGDNNLEKYLDEDLNEMERGYRNTEQVHVLVQQDRASRDGVWRYEVRHDSDPDVIASKLVGESDAEPDTGNWQTLASFGQWAAVCYPAEHYVLVVSGHGSGWSGTPPPEPQPDDEADAGTGEADAGTGDADAGTGEADAGTGVEEGDAGLDATEQKLIEDKREAEEKGEPYRAIAFDDSTNSSLDIDELATALDFIGRAVRRDSDPSYVNRLVIYGSDACLMQTVEVLDAIGSSVTYVVGSERTEPGKGWPYYSIFRELTTRPLAYSRAPQDLAAFIVTAYRDSYGLHGGQGEKEGLTLSAVNLDYRRRLVNDMTKITSLLDQLYEDIHPFLWQARQDSPLYSNTYVDLAELLLHLRASLIDAGLMPRIYQHWDGDERYRTLRNAIDDAVEHIFEATFANLEETQPQADGLADGISIYFPGTNFSWTLPLEDYEYSPFSVKTGWGKLLERVLQDHHGWYPW